MYSEPDAITTIVTGVGRLLVQETQKTQSWQIKPNIFGSIRDLDNFPDIWNNGNVYHIFINQYV